MAERGREERFWHWPGRSLALEGLEAPHQGHLEPQPQLSIDWEGSQNLYCEGDNLEILKLLAPHFRERIQLIYIDPPYNTGHAFVYNDRSGGGHSAWMGFIYPRLALGWQLLAPGGSLAISIDDRELPYLRLMAEELWGEESLVACFPRLTKKAGKSSAAIARNHDYLLLYAKKPATFYLPPHSDPGFKYRDEYFSERGYYKLNQPLDYNSLQYSPSLDYPLEVEGETLYPGASYAKYLERQAGNYARADWAWRWSKELFNFAYAQGFVVLKRYANRVRLYTKTYQKVKLEKVGGQWQVVPYERTKRLSTLEFLANPYSNDQAKKDLARLMEPALFDYAKPLALMERLCQLTTGPQDWVLDFFAGSAATAQAVWELNARQGARRHFIMVQLPEACAPNSRAYQVGLADICAIGRQRLRLARERLQRENPQPGDYGFQVWRWAEGPAPA